MKALPNGSFDAVDIVAVLNEQSDYTRNRNYWKYLKNKLKKENPQLVSAANQLKLTAPDGKKRLTDCFDSAFERSSQHKLNIRCRLLPHTKLLHGIRKHS